MIFSFTGIVIIQSLWIKDSYDQKRKQLEMHVNDALNGVVEDIGEKEAEKYLNFRYGGVDSLVHEFIIKEEDSIANGKSHKEHMMIISEEVGLNEKIRIEVGSDSSETITISNEDIILEKQIEDTERMHQIHERMVVKMEKIHEDLAGVLSWSENIEEKMGNVEAVVKHFTIESLFGNELKNRFTKEELENYLSENLQREGVKSDFAYTIRDNKKEAPYENYYSSNFNQDAGFFSKNLFPKDKKPLQYEILVQIPNADSIVWTSIQPMIWLSVLFTLLIVLAFAFALYFIWKQKKVSETKNDFINNMTHELKTPLASISIANASIRHPEVLKDQDQIFEFTAIIDKERVRMNSHIEKVLEIASIDNKDLELKLKKESFNNLISNSIGFVDMALKERNGKVVFESQIDSAMGEIDSFHFTNALTNILENSIKYCDDQPEIMIHLKEKNLDYKIQISDNGIGMSPKAVKHAFDRFYREESGNIHNRKGFGLGLSYVKSIVELHKGSVSISSQKGKGTTVIMKIPKSNES